MSNLPAIANLTDMTESDSDKIKKFVDEGLPGLSDVTDVQLFRMYDMYLTGSTYSQISTILGIKRVVVLYLAQNSDWFTSKQEHLNELQESIKSKVAESQIKNKEFMLLLVQSYRKKIGHKLSKFLATSDDKWMNDIDLKELAQLMKAIEIVDEINSSGKIPTKTPAVGINIGEGVTIEKSGDNKVSITPKESSVGDMLKKYADEQREEERLALTKATKHDINSNKE